MVYWIYLSDQSDRLKLMHYVLCIALIPMVTNMDLLRGDKQLMLFKFQKYINHMLGELDEFLPEDVLEKLDEVKHLNKEKKINKVCTIVLKFWNFTRCLHSQ